MTDRERPSQYPDSLSRQLQEGGYTFLHRVFGKCMETKKPTVISTGDIYLQYKYEPGHKTFMEGISILEGDESSEMYERFKSVAETFDLETAFKESRYLPSGEKRRPLTAAEFIQYLREIRPFKRKK